MSLALFVVSVQEENVLQNGGKEEAFSCVEIRSESGSEMIVFCAVRYLKTQGVLEPACACSHWPTRAHCGRLFPALRSGHHAGSLVLAAMGIFTPWKLAYAISQSFSSQRAGC